jgi:ABC-type multidrug transport system ATPase subunit
MAFSSLHRFIRRATISSTTTVLQVDGLCFGYPQCPLFVNLSLRVPPGVSLVRGGDGGGKTTLLRLLAGDLPADAGSLHIKGIGLDSAPTAYRQQVFWVDPRMTTFDQLTPKDYFASLRTTYPQFATQSLGNLTSGLSLTEHLDKPIYMLSTGSKRKVWLVAAFASGADLTMLDEPFAALDKSSIAFVMQQLRDLAQRAGRACLVAHYDALIDAQGEVPLASQIDLGD